MQQRIDRLEGLVKTLMSQAQTVPSSGISDLPHNTLTPDSGNESLEGKDDESAIPFNLGTTVVNGGHSVYKAADNWSDVLQEVRLPILTIAFIPVVLGTYIPGTFMVPLPNMLQISAKSS